MTGQQQIATIAEPEPMVETDGWIRVVPNINNRGKVTSLTLAGLTKNRPTGKGAYVHVNLRFPKRLFEFPDTEIDIEVTDSTLGGSTPQIVADLAELRDELT